MSQLDPLQSIRVQSSQISSLSIFTSDILKNIGYLMPIDVTCAACQAEFQVKDEFAGRKVRCSQCKSVIELPEADVDVAPIDDSNYDPVFQRDKFLLHQKHLSINTQYFVSDEAGNNIMYVVRPTHFFRSLIAMLGVLLALIVPLILLIAGVVTLHPQIGDLGSGLLLVSGIIASGLLTILAYQWLAPKRHIYFFADEEKQKKILEILQDQKIAVRMATYTVLDENGEEIGRYRKDYLANFLRKRWDGFHPDGTQLYVIREDSVLLSLLRRFLGSFYGLLRTNFVIHQVDENGNDGPLLGEFNRKFTLLDKYVLDCTHDRSRKMDRRMAIAIGVLLDTGEQR